MDIKDYQKRLFPYAYNILGSHEDAKDAVQDVIIKYYSADKPDIDNPINYLIKSVINQSINIKKKAINHQPLKFHYRSRYPQTVPIAILPEKRSSPIL